MEINDYRELDQIFCEEINVLQYKRIVILDKNKGFEFIYDLRTNSYNLIDGLALKLLKQMWK